MKKFISLFVLVIIGLQGCGFEAQQDISPQQLGNEAVVDQTKADEAKKIVLSMEEVYEVKGVTHNDKIYVAPNVHHFDRLRLEEIRKTGFEKIKKRYPEETVFFTTDKKIYMELEKLETELKNREISPSALEEKLSKLEDDMKG
ncbi:YhcN/YlaJ family sporulation lipoprotein [Alkalihalobacterium bogoriense]|uniref:YhcN/YlaJ family sporulation lipoprotein n=1 Tax=Alkalihalobacterium bogoriense TaxID=246272 RepID=UPI00047CC193|nr:YhcN/YlaJ family sporulation lipoprotein [Alkalihalobacterium bogoriense]